MPCHPLLTQHLLAHISEFGTTRDGRLFRGERGGDLSESVYSRVWSQARSLALSPSLARTPIAGRPYDLRHYADRLVMCPAATFPLAGAAGLVFLSA